MVAMFDNLADVDSKFSGTVCYYEKKPIIVKGAAKHPEKENEFTLLISSQYSKPKYVNLNDPNLNWRDYNIGYANIGPCASWWYRRPAKQYRQGLKKDQLSYKTSNVNLPPDEGFNYSKPFILMLEDSYPDIKLCKHILEEGNIKVISFNRDFALSYNKLHEAHVLEYHGKYVGVSTNQKLTEYRLMPEFQHLQEALQEAIS